MSKKISLSIVIPAYNEEHHLRRCLRAIAEQTEKPDEVIVIDNNSTDKTAQIASHYPFVRVLKEPKQGVVFARDRGFDAVTSDIIGRIDADSLLPPSWVHYVKRFYQDETHQNHALTGGCYFYNVRLPRFAGWWQEQIAFRVNRWLMGHYILYGSNMAVTKELWQEVRGGVCHDVDVHEDLDLAIHAYRAGYDITFRSGLKVGVKMRRVRTNRKELLDNLMWWPKTLKRHGKKTWIFGWVGALLLFAGWPVVVAAEYLARALGRPPLED